MCVCVCVCEREKSKCIVLILAKKHLCESLYINLHDRGHSSRIKKVNTDSAFDKKPHKYLQICHRLIEPHKCFLFCFFPLYEVYLKLCGKCISNSKSKKHTSNPNFGVFYVLFSSQPGLMKYSANKYRNQVPFLAFWIQVWSISSHYVLNLYNTAVAMLFICQSCWKNTGTFWTRSVYHETAKKAVTQEIKNRTKFHLQCCVPVSEMLSNYFRSWFVDWRGRGSQQTGMLGCSSGDADEGPPFLPEFWRTRSPWAACFHWSPECTHKNTHSSKDNTRYQTIRAGFSTKSISREKLSK